MAIGAADKEDHALVPRHRIEMLGELQGSLLTPALVERDEMVLFCDFSE